MHFKVGEKVSFLTETGYGIVKHIKDGSWVLIEDETGFDREVLASELVKIYGDQSQFKIDEFDYSELHDVHLASGQQAPRGVTKFKDYWEVDLHSHSILDTERGLSNGQILAKQLYEFKRCYSEVTKSKVRKLIVIHGVGSGVLKEEIRFFLEGKEGIEFYDADFREYGKGATEVRLYYKF